MELGCRKGVAYMNLHEYVAAIEADLRKCEADKEEHFASKIVSGSAKQKTTMYLLSDGYMDSPRMQCGETLN